MDSNLSSAESPHGTMHPPAFNATAVTTNADGGGTISGDMTSSGGTSHQYTCRHGGLGGASRSSTIRGLAATDDGVDYSSDSLGGDGGIGGAATAAHADSTGGARARMHWTEAVTAAKEMRLQSESTRSAFAAVAMAARVRRYGW